MANNPLASIHEKLGITRRKTVDRDEYVRIMTFQQAGPPLLTEIFGPLIGLPEEWKQQGASQQELDFSAFRYRQPVYANLPAWAGLVADRTPEVIEETDAHILARDGMGRLVKLCKDAASLPLPMEYPVKAHDDWLKVRHWLTFTEARLEGPWREAAQEAVDQGHVITLTVPGGFDTPRQLMGDELACLAYYDQPELMHEILDTITDTALQVLDRVTAEVPVDRIFVHEDMAGKNGPLAGPAQVREFIAPYYRKVWDLASDRGVKLFSQDSDGNMMPVIESFLEAGVNVIYPNEPAAGMDIVAIREQFGKRLALVGGIDKHVLRSGHDAIRRELEAKLIPLARDGGIMFGLDHRIPNGTPLEAYRYYLETAWEILDRQ